MELKDARRLSQDAQESIRFRAVRLVIEEKKKQTEVANIFGVTRVAVAKWLSKFRAGGEAALKKKKRGRISSDMTLLQPHQCATIVKLITDKCPNQLKLPFMLWTREAVNDLIEQKFGIRLSINSVGNYLKRWGFTPQKPVHRSYERQDIAVKKWLEETYPEISKRASREGAEIHWGDEAGFRSDHQTGTSYGLRGKTPVIKKTGKRFRTNMISTVTNKGTLRFMMFDESFTVKVFLKFLERLISKEGKKIFLVLDNHKVHHAKLVKSWIEKRKDKIELFFLPAYSPDLNPDELLNQDVKSNAVGRKGARSLIEFRGNIMKYLFGTQKSPSIIRNFFQKPEVMYAA